MHPHALTGTQLKIGSGTKVWQSPLDIPPNPLATLCAPQEQQDLVLLSSVACAGTVPGNQWRRCSLCYTSCSDPSSFSNLSASLSKKFSSFWDPNCNMQVSSITASPPQHLAVQVKIQWWQQKNIKAWPHVAASEIVNVHLKKLLWFGFWFL